MDERIKKEKEKKNRQDDGLYTWPHCYESFRNMRQYLPQNEYGAWYTRDLSIYVRVSQHVAWKRDTKLSIMKPSENDAVYQSSRHICRDDTIGSGIACRPTSICNAHHRATMGRMYNVGWRRMRTHMGIPEPQRDASNILMINDVSKWHEQ